MLIHLKVLVPGQGAAQRHRQRAQCSGEGLRDLGCFVAVGQSDQHGEPGAPLDQGRDRGLGEGADDEIALPVPHLSSALDIPGSAVDGAHRWHTGK